MIGILAFLALAFGGQGFEVGGTSPQGFEIGGCRQGFEVGGCKDGQTW